MAGIGKTSLAHAYAWHFGAAYPGGVYLTILTGARDSEAAVAQQAEEVLPRRGDQTGGQVPLPSKRQGLFGAPAKSPIFRSDYQDRDGK